MNQTTDLKAIADALRQHDRFLVVTHENPDGDALGSLLAATLALRQLGKDAVMYLAGQTPLPREYAFMRTVEEARRLAEAMRALGEQAGMDVVCLLTDMEQPLGRAVGNALEVREAYETLGGGGPADFRDLVIVAGTYLLALSDLGLDEEAARERVTTSLADGSALSTYERWIRAQGGDPDPALLPNAEVVRQVPAPAEGFVREVHARDVAGVATALGAGRERKDAQGERVGEAGVGRSRAGAQGPPNRADHRDGRRHGSRPDTRHGLHQRSRLRSQAALEHSRSGGRARRPAIAARARAQAETNPPTDLRVRSDGRARRAHDPPDRRARAERR